MPCLLLHIRRMQRALPELHGACISGDSGRNAASQHFCEEPVPAEQTQNSHDAAETALIEAAASQPSQDLCRPPVLLPVQSSFLLRVKKQDST